MMKRKTKSEIDIEIEIDIEAVTEMEIEVVKRKKGTRIKKTDIGEETIIEIAREEGKRGALAKDREATPLKKKAKQREKKSIPPVAQNIPLSFLLH